jgi:hypothetical protein
MKGLEKLPSVGKLARAADRLQRGQSIMPAELALYCQWARLDPRFAEILVQYFAKFWRLIPTGEFIDALNRQPWPQAAIVILSFSESLVPRNERRLLRHLTRAISATISACTPQLFFIPLQRPNSVVMHGEVNFRSEPYRKAGFIGSQSLLARAQWPQGRTFLRKRLRLLILKELLTTLGKDEKISVEDYRRACKGMVSSRQAQRDLAELATPSGFTRGRRYRRPLAP